MNSSVEASLLAASGLLIVLERSGLPTTLQLACKEHVKRQTTFLAQWGQASATSLVAMTIWQLDPARRRAAVGLIGALVLASLCSLMIKRLVGRVRPNRPLAGQFLGVTFRHDNWRESFPSSHSACAMAVSVYLAMLYPPLAPIFLTLGAATSLLRYVMDAHWPSDVLAGVALGYACGSAVFRMAA